MVARKNPTPVICNFNDIIDYNVDLEPDVVNWYMVGYLFKWL